jgi:hypothetical protein
MQAAEYGERLQFAKEVATTNGAVVSQAPGNAPSETPAAAERETVATS